LSRGTAAAGLGVAEEAGDADQQVFEQGPELTRVGSQDLQVVRQALDVPEPHSTADASDERAELVAAEVEV
jgi:hypothetical protein